MQIAPPDWLTKYELKHYYGADGTQLDANGKPASPRNPAAHIPIR